MDSEVRYYAELKPALRPFNSIEWIPKEAAEKTLELAITFNSIEWIPNKYHINPIYLRMFKLSIPLNGFKC